MAKLPLPVLALFVCLALACVYVTEAAQETSKENPGRAERAQADAPDGRMSLLKIRKFCDDDIKKICPDIRPGGGRIVQCLHGHQASLSAGCRQFLAPGSTKP